NPASGFQSAQFRIMEFRMGCKNPAYLKFYQDDDPLKSTLVNAYNSSSLWDEVLNLLSKRGLSIPNAVLNRDFQKNYQASTEVTEEIVKIYKAPDQYFDLYQLLESLMDFDE